MDSRLLHHADDAMCLGITHAPTFTRRTTHLLCPSREGKKFEKAPEWGIDVVGMDWLHAVAREGRVPKVAGSASGKVSAPVQAPGKGKGKGRMGDDITSGEWWRFYAVERSC